MRTHLLQANTNINKNFHIFVIEAPCLAVILCELDKFVSDFRKSQWSGATFVQEIWVKLRVAQARWNANVVTQNMVENIAAAIESRTLLW